MSEWLIVPEERIAELQAINAQFNDRKCSAHLTVDGVWLTGADKLGDAYWGAYQVFLSGLAEFTGDPQFPEALVGDIFYA